MTTFAIILAIMAHAVMTRDEDAVFFALIMFIAALAISFPASSVFKL